MIPGIIHSFIHSSDNHGIKLPTVWTCGQFIGAALKLQSTPVPHLRSIREQITYKRILPYDFSTLVDLAVLGACTIIYSIQMIFQNVHLGSRTAQLGGKAKVTACLSEMGEGAP